MRFLFNTYRGYAALFLQGSSDYLLSKEGVTQGDPLSMMLYAVAILPLIRSLKNSKRWTQNWYADDSACVATLPSLHAWFSQLLSSGPAFGYLPQPVKTVLVVSPSYLNQAASLSSDLGIKVVSGSRFLGGFVGECSMASDFVAQKVKMWVDCVQRLSDVAKVQPQAAHAAVSRSLQFEWSFLQRVIPNCAAAFVPIRDAIHHLFYPAVLGGPVSEFEVRLFDLPARAGGLGISDPVKSASVAFTSSLQSSAVLRAAISGQAEFSPTAHFDLLDAIRREASAARGEHIQSALSALLSSVSASARRAIERAVDFGVSGWLTVLPLAQYHFDLSPQQFRDALSLRYNWSLMLMPPTCDGCGAAFTLSHALDCRRGGLVVRRHNEIRDALEDLASLAYKDVIREPVVRDGDADGPGLIADLGVRGVWQPQGEALFDVRVVDTDAQSYISRSVADVLVSAEEEKKRKYRLAAEACHASFSPFVISVDGALGKEAALFLSRIADRLSVAWGRSYGNVLGWLKARLGFAVIRATNICLRDHVLLGGVMQA